jgi:hypothetical protein
MFLAGPSDHRKRQIGPHHQGLRIAFTQNGQAGAIPTAGIKNPGRAEPNRIKAVHHPLFDLAVKKVGIGSPRCAPVKLTPNGG